MYAMKRSYGSYTYANTSRPSRDFKSTAENPLKVAKEDQPELEDPNLVYVMEPEYLELEENFEEEVEEEVVEQEFELENGECVPEQDFTSQLARLVKNNDCPNDFTDNLLNLLRKNGHADLPSDKKSLVTEPPPPSDDATLAKILENQRLMMRNQTLIMEQMKALARSHATQRIRLAGMSERLDKVLPRNTKSTLMFPIKTLDDFLDFDERLSYESFRLTFSELSRAMLSETWLFSLVSDDVLHHYNLNGIKNQRSLRGTTLWKVLDENFPDNEFMQDAHVQSLIRTCHARIASRRQRSRASALMRSARNSEIDELNSLDDD
ncbi:uncharacterized protein LOC132257396 isoform X2 [Phlebotomus argentipes]|uniref:uncharacterized protein LOC132257396 isoform X2 n=1 Tax=Phlebotomus argentipes TaxID=94469 RepID=UPI002892C6DF|nr:uncharacterized protein LOC132257396 isoform X2 [Phlebotomus argentipes]